MLGDVLGLLVKVVVIIEPEVGLEWELGMGNKAQEWVS
jgi:hypothetical protein